VLNLWKILGMRLINSINYIMNKQEYREYLNSNEWKILRAKKLKKSKKYRCAICKATKELNIHHLFYRPNLADTELSDLRILCHRCHKLIHELEKKGEIKYVNKKHHSRFGIIKHAVKKELGIPAMNLFKDKKYIKRVEILRTEIKKMQKIEERNLATLKELLVSLNS